MSQNELIYQALKEGQELTCLEVLYKFGSMNLRSRISDIEKKYRITIDREMIEQNGKRFNKYFIKNFKLF